MKPKIVYLPIDRYGGVFTFFLSLIKTLSLKSTDIVLVNSTIESELVIELKNITSAIIKPLKKNNKNQRLNRLKNSFYISDKYGNSHQIFYTDFNPILDFGAFSSKDVYCFSHSIPMRKFPEFVRRGLTKLVNKNNFNLIVVSNYQKKKLKNTYYKNNVEIQVLRNHSSFQPKLGAIKLRKPTVVASIGHCTDYKGVYEWLEVAEELAGPNIIFCWYGDGPELSKVINMTSDNDYIKFMGYENNIEKIINQIDVYTQFSKRENLSISVLDNMSQAVPCLVTNVGAMDELIDNGFNGFIINSKEEAVRAIKKLISDSELYESMSENAIRKYTSEFSYEIWKKNLETIIVKG